MEKFTGRVVDSKDTRFGDCPDSEDFEENKVNFRKTKSKEVLRFRVY